MSLFTAKIIGREAVTENIVQVALSRPPSFRFSAGQYLQFGLPRLLHRDHRGPSRVFSIVSSPNDEDEIAVAFRRSPSGFKRTLEESAFGSAVTIAGPYGFHTLSKEPRRPLALVASGVGITPHLSMIRFAVEQGFTTPITLLYANRTRQGAAYLNELEQLATRHRSFALRTSLGTLDERALQHAVAANPGAVWHLTGAPSTVTHARDALSRFGVEEERVCIEEFLGY